MTTELRAGHERLLHAINLSPHDLWLSVSHSLSNFVMLVDREHRIVYINRVTDWLTVDSVIGKSALEFVIPDKQDFFREQIDQVFATGNPVTYRIKGFGDKGSLEDYASKIVPVVEQGDTRFVAVITLDLTAVERSHEFPVED